MAEPHPGARMASSLRSLGTTLVEIVATRVELALVELREEGLWRRQALVLAVVGGLFLAMGLLLAAFFFVVLFWDSHRLAAIAAVTLLYLSIAAVAFLRLRTRSRNRPPPFEATLRELAADREALRTRDE